MDKPEGSARNLFSLSEEEITILLDSNKPLYIQIFEDTYYHFEENLYKTSYDYASGKLEIPPSLTQSVINNASPIANFLILRIVLCDLENEKMLIDICKLRDSCFACLLQLHSLDVHEIPFVLKPGYSFIAQHLQYVSNKRKEIPCLPHLSCFPKSLLCDDHVINFLIYEFLPRLWCTARDAEPLLQFREMLKIRLLGENPDVFECEESE
jgi:hypothetical protein